MNGTPINFQMEPGETSEPGHEAVFPALARKAMPNTSKHHSFEMDFAEQNNLFQLVR